MTDLLGSKFGVVSPIPVRQYPDGSPLVNAPDPVPDTLMVRGGLDALNAALMLVDAMIERGHSAPHLVVPCLPGQRQDRLNDSGDYLFTAKSVARAINARGCPTVTVLDPHSDVMPALIERCRVVHAEFYKPDTYAGVISPDAGAEKRAARIAKTLGIPLYRAWKTRDVKTGSLAGFGVEVLSPDSHYLVADDLCDGGGTFVGLAGQIAAFGATADLYVTHGLFTQGTEKLLTSYRAVFCTDSTLGEKPGVTVLPRCLPLLREAR